MCVHTTPEQSCPALYSQGTTALECEHTVLCCVGLPLEMLIFSSHKNFPALQRPILLPGHDRFLHYVIFSCVLFFQMFASFSDVSVMTKILNIRGYRR